MQQVCVPVGMNEKNPHCIETETYGRLFGVYTMIFLSVQRIIIFEPLQWFVEFSRNGNNTFTEPPHINSKRTQPTHSLACLLAGWLSWWTWQVRTFKSIKNESKFLSTFFLITVSFCFIINTWIAIVAFTRWMRLEAILIVIYGRSWEQKKRAEQTNNILEITRRFFAFSWSLK